MVYTPLTQLITALEAGTNLHVCVAFFTPTRNHLTNLPSAQIIHSSPYCTEMKKNPEQMSECYGIREKKFKQAKEEKKPFVSRCSCGITEYLHPVLQRDSVICLLMISGKTPEDGSDPNFYLIAAAKAKILENHVRLLTELTHKSPDEPDPFAAQVSELLREDLTERVSMKELAQSLGYHEKYLGAKFKQKTGKSPVAYRNDRRLAKAEGYLRNTGLPIIEIAVLVGFDNVSYFNRLFRARCGITPTEYRKRNRK